MPIYEYQCSQCNQRQEVIQRFSDPPLSECEHCGGDMKKLPSSPAIQFKGSGFYKTDYASGSGTSSKGDGKSESKSESKSDGGSETKSESKSDVSTAAPSPSESKPAAKSESKSAE
jgi:putative FmdB family regulatory protein